jgi:hypothetical protein
MVESARPARTNCTAMAQRIRPRTRTTTTMPILPRIREMRVENQKARMMVKATAAITATPTATPPRP